MHVLTTGEDAEFTALVHRQSRFVFRVAYAVLLNSHDAEDAVQETFLKLYRNRGWQHLDNERAFLARVAWRVAVDKRPRASQSISHSFDTSSESSHALDSPSPHPGPEQTILLANQHAIVHSMIDALPEELRLPLVLSVFDERHLARNRRHSRHSRGHRSHPAPACAPVASPEARHPSGRLAFGLSH